uniref:Uncharacterized protein n=1 Tax=Terrapene triunguis TaxID=2587831 RepID=A0A674IV01_9SAUR
RTSIVTSPCFSSFSSWFLFPNLIQLCRRRQQLLKALDCFPGPPRHWLYGHAHELQDQELNKVISWAEKYPCAHSVWFGGFLGFLNIYHPEYAKAVYSRGGENIRSSSTESYKQWTEQAAK